MTMRLVPAVPLLLALLCAGCGNAVDGDAYGQLNSVSNASSVDFTAIGFPLSYSLNTKYSLDIGTGTVKWHSNVCACTKKKSLEIKPGESDFEAGVVDGILGGNENTNGLDRVYEWKINGDNLIKVDEYLDDVEGEEEGSY